MSSGDDKDKAPQTPGGGGKTGLSSESEDSDAEGAAQSSPKPQASEGRPTAGGKGPTAMGGGGGGGGGDGKTGLSDDEDEDDAPSATHASGGGGTTKRKVVDSDSDGDDDGKGGAEKGENEGEKEGEEEASSQPAAAGHTGLSSDSDSGDEAALKESGSGGGKGDEEMADATHKDVFGDSDSDEDDGARDSGKHKGQKVMLNKETGRLERGAVEDAPDHAIQDSQVGQDRSSVPKETLKLTFPKLPRPGAGARLVYMNPPKRHLILDPAPFASLDEEAKKFADERAQDETSKIASRVRWRFKDGKGEGSSWEARPKESNARLVQWSDGSMTIHVGSEVLEVKQEPLPHNEHHLYVKQAKAKTAASEDGEEGSNLSIIEGHGVMDARLVIKPTEMNAGRRVLATVSKQYGKKSVDKESIFVKKNIDEKAAEKRETLRIRNQARREGAKRRAGASGEMNEDFLENDDIDGDVGGFLARSKRQRRLPNPSALQRAKASRGSKDSDSDSDSSSDSSESDPAPRKRAAVSSSSSSSESSSDEEGPAVKKKPGPSPASTKKAAIESSSESD